MIAKSEMSVIVKLMESIPVLGWCINMSDSFPGKHLMNVSAECSICQFPFDPWSVWAKAIFLLCKIREFGRWRKYSLCYK